MSFKIAFIGAGSIGFTRGLFTDLMSIPAFHNIEVAFTDINQHNLDMVTQLCQRDLDENGIDIQIQATLDRREAFKGAKYIFNCVRIGGLEAFEMDVNIPLKYGVDQCVGDTLCTGGIMYGQRVIAAMLDFCKDMREVADKDVLHLNYSNPNAMVTWACNIYGGIKTLGLCHGVIHGQEQIAEVLGLKYEDIDVICAGLNHQTWYRKRPEEIKDWIDLGSWINGETGGYLRVCTEGRTWFETDFPNWLKGPAKKYDGSDRGKEHGSYIIEALETGKVYRGHFNVINNGCITNLPEDCVVEVPCYVDGNGIMVPKVGDLPTGCAAICSQSVWVQRLAVEAAVSGNEELLKQAALLDPLTGAICNPPEVWQMIDEMIIAQEEWLPQYKEAIVKAKERWQEGNLILTKENKGAARLKTKTIEEMSLEKDKMRRIASAAAKENVR
ncbi:MAG: alpha-glucosidase/alpha-galactosidase, partial [Clostridium sp.]